MVKSMDITKICETAKRIEQIDRELNELKDSIVDTRMRIRMDLQLRYSKLEDEKRKLLNSLVICIQDSDNEKEIELGYTLLKDNLGMINENSVN